MWLLSARLDKLTTHLPNQLPNTNHREGLDRLDLEECESAFCKHVHHEYLVATDCRHAKFQARWIVASWGRVFQLR